MKIQFLKCPTCKRIHVGIAEAAAIAEVESFNEYLDSLSPDDRQSHYGGRHASIEKYKKCRNCGASSETFITVIGYENSGMTMQTVIAPRKKQCDQ
jgi:rubredoxin